MDEKISATDLISSGIWLFIGDCVDTIQANYGPEHSINAEIRRVFLSVLSEKDFAELTDEELATFDQDLIRLRKEE